MVRKIVWLSLLLIGLGVLLFLILQQKPPKAPSSTVGSRSEPEKVIRYDTRVLSQSVVHTLLIPANGRFSVTPALSHNLSTLERFAREHQAVAAINGGFFDPQNQKSTSFVIQQGKLVADPRQNERLMNNPELAPYLDKILNRTEFRHYRCGAIARYDIVLHDDPTPNDCTLVDSLGAGPRLLPELTSLQEGFLDIANGEVIRDSLSSRFPNARSAIGITREGDVVLVMVAQKPSSLTPSGMSLTALADFMKTLGVERAMNLDGGSSSAFYYKGKTIYGKVDERGYAIARPVLSVLLVL